MSYDRRCKGKAVPVCVSSDGQTDSPSQRNSSDKLCKHVVSLGMDSQVSYHSCGHEEILATVVTSVGCLGVPRDDVTLHVVP